MIIDYEDVFCAKLGSSSKKWPSWKLQQNAENQCGYRKRVGENFKEPADRTIQELFRKGII